MSNRNTVLFLCQHGGAKSVIAASYFNRVAEERALPYRAVAAAAEDPYAAVPEPVSDLLQREGFDVRDFRPRQVEAGDWRGAAKVVGIDCELAAHEVSSSMVEQWTDVPKVSEDLDGSAVAIRRLVATLAEELGGRR